MDAPGSNSTVNLRDISMAAGPHSSPRLQLNLLMMNVTVPTLSLSTRRRLRRERDRPFLPGNNMEVNKRPKPKPVRVIGKNQASSRIKASGAVIAKAVFCVSNVSLDDSTENVVECLKDNGITVLSCGKANTRFTETKAFRVCIAEADSDRFLDSDIWPENVIVRSWVFKGKKSEDSSTNTNDGHAD